ncbi:hypothetical protein EMCRGX_G018325 [Ephydatia muelleri]
MQDVAGEIEVQEAHGLVSQMRTFFDHFEERVLLLRDQQPVLEEYSQPRFGRPPYLIPASQIEEMMELGYSYESMARIFNVSSRTLRRYRQQYNLPRGRLFSELTDDQLDHLISEILQVTPDIENVDKQVGVAAFVNEPTPHFNADWQMRLPTILQTQKHNNQLRARSL